MIELNVQQGSREWLEARAKCLTASEAPAMMGVSNYKTRAALIREKATGYVPEPDAAALGRFAAGHAAEADARSIIETIIGAGLYPVVATDDTGKYLASSDGVASTDGAITFLPDGFEHKLWNEKLAEEVRAGRVPDSHAWQLDHQAMVFDFKRIIFVVSDGTAENMVYCWYYPSKERIERLKAGWAQFEIDVANYQPEEAEAKPVGKAPEMLPALHIEVTGMVTSSNLAAFKEHALAVFSGIKTTNLESDDDFANAEKTAKWCKEVEDRLEAAKQNALGQTSSLDELFRTIDAIKEEARQTRLTLEKQAKGAKENKKAAIVHGFVEEFSAYCKALTARVGTDFTALFPYVEEIKGLKTLTSLKNKMSDCLANAKVEADAIAGRIEINRKAMGDNAHLFPDFANVCTKAADDFANLVVSRRAADAQRKQQEAERVAQAEAVKEITAANQTQFEQPAVVKESLTTAQPAIVAAPIAPAIDNGQTIKLGEICARLGYTVGDDFLATLGFVATVDRSAKLYRESDFPAICRRIADHTLSLAFKKAA